MLLHDSHIFIQVRSEILLKSLQQSPHTNNNMFKFFKKSQNLHKITKNLVFSFGDIFVFYPLYHYPFVVSTSYPPHQASTITKVHQAQENNLRL